MGARITSLSVQNNEISEDDISEDATLSSIRSRYSPWAAKKHGKTPPLERTDSGDGWSLR